MRRFTVTFLALLLVLTNMVLAADIHAEAFSGQHSGVELNNADHHGGPADKHSSCHHCCHAQAHFFSLPQRPNADWLTASGHDWTLMDAAHARLTGHAPPVPPPKA